MSVLKSAFHRLTVTKPLDAVSDDAHATDYKRALTVWDLLALGMGITIGAGIFVLTGEAAQAHAGPAVVLSYLIAGVVAALASLCYAEMASALPLSGSAYSFTYATMGEFLAWVIGWDLILEYLVGSAAVSVGWSAYLARFAIDITNNPDVWSPRWINAPVRWFEVGQKNFWNETVAVAGFGRNVVACGAGSLEGCGAIVNLPAVILILLLTILLVIGIRESARLNLSFVVMKVAIILLFIFASIKFIDPTNYHPFVPPSEGGGRFGVGGVFKAAVMVTFAYIGFDAVTTTAQEAKQPQRDLPIGIIGSLLICTALYVATSAVLTGLVPFREIDIKSPITSALNQAAGPSFRWLTILVDVGVCWVL
ncbi:hypothetical protein HDV00_005467 [Rhizophlyctis rosea]|nr:hypothetical protein HDV00_005467 [Rhizophlyctis rosea]